MTEVKAAGNDEHVPTAAHIISPSGYNTFQSCPKKFWITYGPLKLREENTKHTIRGTLVHSVCEDFWDYNFEVPTGWKEQLRNHARKLFKERWDAAPELHKEGPRFRMETEDMVNNFVEQCIRMISGQFDATPKFGVKGNFKIIKPTTEEDYTLAEHGIRGRVDEVIVLDEKEFLVHHDYLLSEMDEIVISDIKSSKIFRIAYKQEYIDQIHFYALLHYLKYGKYPTHGCVKFVRYGIEAYFEIDTEYVHKMHDGIKELQEKCLKEIDDESKWEANTEYQFCAWCPWSKNGVCKEGTEVHHPEVLNSSEASS